MSNPQDEIERIRRIRERQLALRDPKAKDRAVHQYISSRYTKEKLTLSGVIRDIPGKWIGMFIGGAIGLIIAIALQLLLQTELTWIKYVGYILVFFGIAIGRGLGASMDWRDEDHDALVNRH